MKCQVMQCESIATHVRIEKHSESYSHPGLIVQTETLFCKKHADILPKLLDSCVVIDTI